MKRSVFFLAALPISLALHAQMPRVPACDAKNISLSNDPEQGHFNSGTTRGTLLILRNFGTAACSVLPKPHFGFASRSGQRLDFTWAAPPFMHPGPVQIPVVVPAGAEVTATMTWLSVTSSDRFTCVEPVTMSLDLGRLDGGTVKTVLPPARICGPAGKPVTYTLEPFRRDPVYTPAAPAQP